LDTHRTNPSVGKISTESRLPTTEAATVASIQNAVAGSAESGQAMSTGLAALDQVLRISIGVHLLTGAPGSGRTTFLKQMADMVASTSKAAILFLSYEQSANALRRLSLLRLSGLTAREFDAADAASLPKLEKALAEYAKFSGSTYLTEANPRLRSKEIGDLIQEIKRANPDKRLLVLVDSLDSLPPDFGAGAGLAGTMRELLALAREHWVPIFATCRLPRSGYTARRRPTLANLDLPDGVENLADSVNALSADFSETKELQVGSGPGTRIVDRSILFMVLKHRELEGGRIRFMYRPDRALFEELNGWQVGYLESLED
jgi:predicted ATP-dependent serine protease